MPSTLYITVHKTETKTQVRSVPKSLTRQALTDEPYKNKFKKDVGRDIFSTIAAAPIIKIPVPKKKLEAIETPKYFLKITLRKVYKLAQPKLITIFPRSAQTSEPKLTLKEVLTKKPATIPPNKYVMHIQAIANAQTRLLDII